MRRVPKKGFTLIELITVISIITILMSISMPAFTRVKNAGRRTVCASNLRQAGMAMRMYLDENRDIMPPASRYPSIEAEPEKRMIGYYLDKHLQGERGILLCPGDTGKKVFSREGASYQYNDRLALQNIDKFFLTRKSKQNDTEVLFDYEPFHGKGGRRGAANYLYADLHIGTLENQ